MNIYVTGATGFVGRHLTSFLRRENENVIAVNMRDECVGIHSPDADAIIHLAGLVQRLNAKVSLESYVETNLRLTRTIFDTFIKSRASTLVYFSSIKAVVDDFDNLIEEDLHPAPKSYYGISKYQCELFLNSQDLPNGKRVIILRPCMIYGPGRNKSLELIYTFVKTRSIYPFGKYHNKRSFLYIENLNFIVYRILKDTNIKSASFNLCDDGFISTKDLIKLTAECFSRRILFWNVPSFIIKTATLFGDLFKLPLNSETYSKFSKSLYVSNKKIKEELKINEMPFSLVDSLIRAISYGR